MNSIRALAIACLLVACQSGDATTSRGSSASGTDAKDAGQTTGTTARSNRSIASDNGDTYLGLVCDWTEEGTAWCDDDYTIVYCSNDVWWALDCSEIGAYCGEDDNFIVDCYY